MTKISDLQTNKQYAGGKRKGPRPQSNGNFNGKLYDEHEERVVLATLMKRSPAALDQCHRIPDDAFRLSFHKRVFRRFLELVREGKDPDIHLLKSRLAENRELNSLDSAYLDDLDDGLNAVRDITPHVDRLLAFHRKYRLFEALTSGLAGLEGDESSDEALARVQVELREVAAKSTTLNSTEVDSWPEPMDEAAFYGLAGAFVRLVLPESEADPQALLLTFLVGFGCMVGRGPSYRIEGTRHGVNLNTVLVGYTSDGRKGTATDRAEEMLRRVDPDFIAKRRKSGLSTGEGLTHQVRDPREEVVQIKEKNGEARSELQIVDAGEPDKRLFVVEGEFVRVLQQASRQGNILTSTLRDAHDAKALGSLAGPTRTPVRNHTSRSSETSLPMN